MKSGQGLRILYDGLIYRTQLAGGINRYFANLIVRLPQVYMPSLVVCEAREVNYPSHSNLQVFRCKRLGPYLLTRALERRYLQASTDFDRCDFDVVHPTYYFLLARRSFEEFRRPVVITVYDMIHELFPRVDFFGINARQKRKAVMAAQAIICISENTKKDLLERYAIPESKVTVTYLATEMDAGLSYGPEPVPARPYYLYVGSRASYKNFDGLLAAMAEVVSIEPGVALCVVGKPFSKGELKRIAQLGLMDHVEHYGYANDPHLAKLYRCSVAFVYPSLYEGFGIPPVEAMSCGTAVIASNCSSIPEVVGDAGLLFDPRSKSELAEMMIHLLRDTSARMSLIAKGAQRAKMFSWDKLAAQTVEVYRSVT